MDPQIPIPTKGALVSDVEMMEKGEATASIEPDLSEGSVQDLPKSTWLSKLYDGGVEVHGGGPIPRHEQTDTRYFNVFTVYFTGMLSLLP